MELSMRALGAAIAVLVGIGAALAIGNATGKAVEGKYRGLFQSVEYNSGAGNFYELGKCDLWNRAEG